jgi:hypothetical protein
MPHHAFVNFLHTSGAPDYAENYGGNFWNNRHAGFCGYILAVFSVVSHLVICRFAPCGTPAVAGFRAVALTHTISAPDYRRRRVGDVPPLFVS